MSQRASLQFKLLAPVRAQSLLSDLSSVTLIRIHSHYGNRVGLVKDFPLIEVLSSNNFTHEMKRKRKSKETGSGHVRSSRKRKNETEAQRSATKVPKLPDFFFLFFFRCSFGPFSSISMEVTPISQFIFQFTAIMPPLRYYSSPIRDVIQAVMRWYVHGIPRTDWTSTVTKKINRKRKKMWITSNTKELATLEGNKEELKKRGD